MWFVTNSAQISCCALFAFIDKYGVPTNQWTSLYEALLEVCMNKIALSIHVCADDWMAESVINASNGLSTFFSFNRECFIVPTKPVFGHYFPKDCRLSCPGKWTPHGHKAICRSESHLKWYLSAFGQQFGRWWGSTNGTWHLLLCLRPINPFQSCSIYSRYII